MNEIKSSFLFLKVLNNAQGEFMKVLNFFPTSDLLHKVVPLLSYFISTFLSSSCIALETCVEKGMRCLFKSVCSLDCCPARMSAYALIENILYAPHQCNFSNNRYCILNSFVTETFSFGGGGESVVTDV